ncbi:MAG: enoyl-CoA hydratase/isomerase family protein [Hyphomicrobiales bacterium]
MAPKTDEILFERRGPAGFVTLNRPQALNAVTLDMVRALHARLDKWARSDKVHHVVVRGSGEKAFSAGGDIRNLYDWGRSGNELWRDFYREEYRLNAAIKHFPKPYVALIDGIVMGGGVGVSLHGSHRVASEKLMFAMPEVGIGIFPDVGGSWFLPRLPGEVGTYLALTGARMGLEDARWTGIANHACPSARLDDLAAELAATDDVDAAIAKFEVWPKRARSRPLPVGDRRGLFRPDHRGNPRPP